LPVSEIREAMREDNQAQSRKKARRPPPTSRVAAPALDSKEPYDPEAEANMQQWRLEYESDVRAPRDQRGAYVRERVVTTKDRKAREKNVRDRRRRAERGEDPRGRRRGDDDDEDEDEDDD
jgi:hypothetical protein